MKQRRINATLTIAALALTATLILTVLPRAGTAAPTVAFLSTNPKRINESVEAHLFIRSPFVDSSPGTTTRVSAAPRLERQPLESLTALNSAEATERGAPSAASATAADAQNVELVGQIGGPSYAVAVQGDYAYLGVGPRLVVLDISNPVNPTVVGQTEVLPDVVEGVAVAGNYAYVADGYYGLRIINVTDPAAPTEAGFYDTPGFAGGVAVAGNYAYVADYTAGLRIINVSDPAAPTEAGSCDTPRAYGVAVAGNYAYVAVDYAGLHIINVSNPAAPSLAGSYGTPGHAWGVAVAGNYAYVTDGFEGLHIINVTDPAAPSLAGFYDTPGITRGVAVAGNYAYVADWGGGLRIINVTDPVAPSEAGSYDTGGAWGVAVAGNYAYVADFLAGLRIINVSDPAAPTEAGSYDTPGYYAYGVAVAGNYAYIAAAHAGLHIINVTDPAAPSLAGFYDTQGIVRDVAVAGNYAYVADDEAGLRIINVADPAAPSEAGFYDTPWSARGVAVAGNYAYVVAYWGSLRIINVTDPAAPTEAGFYNMPGIAYGVAVAGNYAYVAAYEAGLRIINVTDPAAPSEAGFYDTPGLATGVAVAGNYAYVADGYGGGDLRIINVTDPAAPSEAGFYDTPAAEGVAVAGNYAYVADGDVRIINVTDPAAPSEAGYYDTPGGAGSVAVAGNYAYVADGGGGLFILRFTGGPPAKPPVVLVHGWQGLGRGSECPDNNIPTRVYPGTNIFFGDLPQWLYDDLDYTEIYEVNLTTGPGYMPRFEENAECLSRQLKWVTDRYGKAILIAHSMGGLVSRAYIENENLYRDDVVRLITLGSPHAGINGGFLLKSLLGFVLPEDVAAYCDKDQGTCQLSTDGVLLFNQAHPSRAPSVYYDFIGGCNWMADLLGWVLRFSDGPNDSRVGLASATGRLWLPIPGQDKVQVDGQFVYRFQTNETHSGYFRDEPGDTRSCLQYLLGENGTGGSCVEATAMMAQTQAPAIAYSLDVRGHITSSQTVTHSLQVDADGASLFYLSWVTGTLGITLTNPVGTVIDPAYAAAHTDVVTYTTSPGSEMTPPFAAYAFTTTVPGLYTATITADDVDITGADYLLFAAMETTRNLSVALDSNHYQIGDTAVLTATLERAGAGITGATVQATFSRSDAITDTLTLTDQGDGAYRGTYAIPNAPGYLHLRVTAEGSDAGTQFSRQVDLLLTVASQAVQLTGTYADHADDTDGNGRYETLTVDVEVLAAGAGDFTFSADLVNGEDQFVAHIITQTALITGTQSVPLRFNGELIHGGGSDGPFTVTNLLISDLQNAGIPSVMADDVWTTAAYDHTQFGRITGDMNGDCIVTVVDIMLVASRWGTRIGNIRYDAIYDQDGDGDIDVGDIMSVAAHWREKCE